jgi:hypothetical protein
MPASSQTSSANTPSERKGMAQPARGTRLPAAHFLQALLLCLLALVALLLGLTNSFKIDPVFATGIGLLLGFLAYRRRLLILSAIVLPLGIVNQLFDKGVIKGQFLEPAHLLALALGLVIVAWAMHNRPRWAAPGARSPGIIIAVLGATLLLAVASGAAARSIFSFWMPVVVLGGMGLAYLVASAFGRVKP